MLLIAAAFGQKAVITDRHGNPPPSEIPAGEVIYFSAAKSEKGAACVPLWLVSPPERRARSEKFEGGTLLVVPAGVDECLLTVTLVVAKGDAPAIETVQVRIVGRQPQPPPVPPKPPEPPPVPVPTGFRVLIIRESGDAVSKEKTAAMFAGSVRKYLNEKCAKNGNQPEWRILDDDTQFAAVESQTMKELFDKAKPTLKSLPAIVIAVNGSFVAQAMPENEAALLALLKSKGG